MDINNNRQNNFCTLTGFLSVSAALKSSYRDVLELYIEPDRYERIRRSEIRKTEKMQYSEIFSAAEKKKIKVTFKSASFFESHGKTCGGLAALVSERRFCSPNVLLGKNNPFFVYLEGIEDPFNFGYTLRSLYLSGCSGVFLPERNYFTSSDIVVRASAGASELIDIALTDDAQALCHGAKEKGIRIVCTSSDKNNVSMRFANLKKPLMLVVGGEKRGISRAVLELADCSVRINYAIKSNIALPTSSAACLLAFAVMRVNE